MNLENFKQAYLKTISESVDESDLKNYIRSIVEENLEEMENNLPIKLKDLIKIEFRPLTGEDEELYPAPLEKDPLIGNYKDMTIVIDGNTAYIFSDSDGSNYPSHSVTLNGKLMKG
jgi:hypothetical protein